MTDFDYDLVIVGGGVAATHTLLSLLDAAPERRLRIAVVEQSDELWRGVPYGRKSSINSLIITDVDEFVPPFEHEAFTGWLSDNWPRLSAALRQEGGAVGSAWLQRHAREIEKCEWGSLYVPRRFYGEFLAEKTRAKLERSNCRVETFKASVRSASREGDGFSLSMEQDGKDKVLRCARILLAVGSPPVQRIGARAGAGAPVIEDMYHPSLDANLEALSARFERLPPGRRRLLILGSNATSLELTYMLNWSQPLRRLIDRIVVLSGGGRLPERIIPPHVVAVATPALDALDGETALTASAIFEASRRDIAALVAEGGEAGCDFSPVSERLVQILSQASEAEIRRFHHVFGIQFTRLIRRAGADYRDAAQSLIDDGKMELRAGRLESLSCGAEGCTPRVSGEHGEPIDLGPPFAAVINCSGFEPLPVVTHPLLVDMLEKSLLQINPTERGFEIDDDFRASDHIFVAGPLLAGVFNTTSRFWHVENVRRIADLAPHLARAILRDLGA